MVQANVIEHRLHAPSRAGVVLAQRLRAMGQVHLWLMMFALVFGFLSVALAGEKVYYPRPESAKDPRTEYPVKLFNLAMKKAGAKYELVPSKDVMNQGRAIVEVEQATGSVTLVWSMTSVEREKKLLPIRIPIYKGLIGWRLPLVTKKNQDRLKNVTGIEDLKQFTAGQGHDWPDTEILRANGQTVEISSNYEGLFAMLTRERFDYFPRSVAEIWAEAEGHAGEGIIVDQSIALHYPAAFYFFVNKSNKTLAEALKKGLELAINDGSFDQLFYEYNSAVITRSALDNRRIIEMSNPLLPPETPLHRAELWFRPKQVVIYPNIDGLGSRAIGYKVLELALAKSGKPFIARISDRPSANQDRARYELEVGGIGVVDTGLIPDGNRVISPIPLPLDMGILGWRLLLIHKDKASQFESIKTLEGLRTQVAGQGKNWGDVAILKNAGISVIQAESMESLLRAGNAQRFDFIPLGASEAFGILGQSKSDAPDLVVEPSLALHYKFGRFFYVRNDNKTLRQAIEAGMKKAVADGSLQALLKEHPMYGDAFAKANLKGRTIIEIDNPNLPPWFKTIDKKWWFNPVR